MGDLRTRWRAASVFVCLLIADVAIGLTYMLLVRGLAQDYSVWQRTVHTSSTGWSASAARSSSCPRAGSDFFDHPDQSLGVFTLLVTAYLFLRPAKPKNRLGAQDKAEIRGLLAGTGTGTRSAISRSATTRA